MISRLKTLIGLGLFYLTVTGADCFKGSSEPGPAGTGHLTQFDVVWTGGRFGGAQPRDHEVVHIFLDGAEVGQITYPNTFSKEVETGTHTVRLEGTVVKSVYSFTHTYGKEDQKRYGFNCGPAKVTISSDAGWVAEGVTELRILGAVSPAGFSLTPGESVSDILVAPQWALTINDQNNKFLKLVPVPVLYDATDFVHVSHP